MSLQVTSLLGFFFFGRFRVLFADREFGELPRNLFRFLRGSRDLDRGRLGAWAFVFARTFVVVLGMAAFCKRDMNDLINILMTNTLLHNNHIKRRLLYCVLVETNLLDFLRLTTVFTILQRPTFQMCSWIILQHQVKQRKKVL